MTCTVEIQFVLWVAMDTIRIGKAQMTLFLEDIYFLIEWVPGK